MLINETDLIVGELCVDVGELCVDVGETRDVSELDDFGETRDVSELDGDVVVVIVDVIIDGMRDCLGPAVPEDVVEEDVVGVDEIPDETSNRRARLTNLTRFARLLWKCA